MAVLKQNTCTIYLVRHGETDWNLNHKIQGQIDSFLNQTGKDQAKKTSNELANIKFDAVFSSDLSRAKETAEIIVLEKKLAVQTTKELRERRFGKLEGESTEVLKTFEELKKAQSKNEQSRFRYTEDYESDEELILRIIIFLREIAVGYTNKTVLMVTHGGVIRAILNHLGEGDTYVGNAAFVRLESDGIDFFIKETKGVSSRKFRDTKVLIFGLGLNGGGVGSAKFFAKNGALVRITDLKSKEVLKPSIDELKNLKIEYTLGKHKKEDFKWADLIIKNPGVKPDNEYLKYANSLGKQIEQDMGIFLDYVKPSQIIGVTGTKGKSTTASLIYEALKPTKKEIILAGNIGKSVLDTIDHITPDTLVILEISSFQLEAFNQHKVSPKYAVITNIYPDHLNYYKNMDEYINSKKIIGKYQTKGDFLFINKDSETVNNSKFLEDLGGEQILYSISGLPQDFHPILQGEHNKSNIAAALAVGKIFNINSDLLLKSLAEFSGVPFRMELIKQWKGVKIINDTTATTPNAAIQAIKTFPNSILICGGMNKGMEYSEFAKVINKNCKKVFFLEGDATEEIKRQFQISNFKFQIEKTYKNLDKLLTDVKTAVKSGDTILFSPGATSFNLFQNEFDRGRKFNLAVEKVFK